MEKREYDDMMEHKEWAKKMVREAAINIAGDTTAPKPAESDVAKQMSISGKRKTIPIATGVIDYFPDALAAVAYCSHIGNEQHNPGTTLHWDRDKSKDHADCMIRHYLDRGTTDADGVLHSAKMVWRALALLQVEIENAKAKSCQ